MNSRVYNLLIILTLVSMESSHLVIFSTSGKFITKFNVLRCISLSETLFWTGPGVDTNHLKSDLCQKPSEFTWPLSPSE